MIWSNQSREWAIGFSIWCASSFQNKFLDKSLLGIEEFFVSSTWEATRRFLLGMEEFFVLFYTGGYASIKSAF